MLFVMVTTVLLGVGSGYFLWGSRVAQLTQTLSGLTLELDTMRARLAAPRGGESNEGATKAADELRVINESIAAFRQELAEQKALLEKTAASAAAAPADAGEASTDLRTARTELAACVADKQDLEARCAAAAAAPTPAPSYQPLAPR